MGFKKEGYINILVFLSCIALQSLKSISIILSDFHGWIHKTVLRTSL